VQLLWTLTRYAKLVKVQLTRKLATILNGIDVSSINVGDILDAAAGMLVAEGWAVRVSQPSLEPLIVPTLPSIETA
jgi:hypothetical protein